MCATSTHVNDDVLRQASRDSGGGGVEIDGAEEEVVVRAGVAHLLRALDERQDTGGSAEGSVAIGSPARCVHGTAQGTSRGVEVEQTQVFWTRTARLVEGPQIVRGLHPERVRLGVVHVAVVHHRLSAVRLQDTKPTCITLNGIRPSTLELPLLRSSSASSKQPLLHHAGSLATVPERPRTLFLPT